VEAGGKIRSPEIAAQLLAEGFGTVSENSIRTWKMRDLWSLTKHVAFLATGGETVPPGFDEMGSALRTLGVTIAVKLTDFVKASTPTELVHAEALARIMCDAVNAAAELDQGVIARYQALSARNGDTAKVIDGVETKPQSHVDKVVEMFTNPARSRERNRDGRPDGRLQAPHTSGT
jgi:hypothetical protein